MDDELSKRHTDGQRFKRQILLSDCSLQLVTDGNESVMHREKSEGLKVSPDRQKMSPYCRQEERREGRRDFLKGGD